MRLLPAQALLAVSLRSPLTQWEGTSVHSLSKGTTFIDAILKLNSNSVLDESHPQNLEEGVSISSVLRNRFF